RYTLADLAFDLRQQMTGLGWEPMRDWFLMSAYGVVGNLFDHLNPTASIGSLFADVHPNQGIFSPLLVNQRTRQLVPIASFFNVEQLLRDLVQITDRRQSPGWINARVRLAILRNFNVRKAPLGFDLADLARLLEQLLPRFRSEGADWRVKDNADPEWRLLM